MDVVSLCPLRASSLLWQPRPGASALTVICKATFDLRPGEARLADEQEYANDDENHWNDDPDRSLYSPSDRAPFKRRTDVLLVGHAFSPNRRPVTSLVVRLAVGAVDKSIEVVGERFWALDGGLREGQAFVKMPLRYERAAGGPDTDNPVGVRSDGAGAIPNLQVPGTQLVRPGQRIAPVGFGPIAWRWPRRRAKLGPFAAAWYQEPWHQRPLPDDLDPSFFNAAPPDQQPDRIAADATIILENLSAVHPRLHATLPGLHPRAFVERAEEGLDELPLIADTLWIDTDRSICTLVWRGQLPLRHPMEDGQILVLLEELARPLTWAEIKQRCRARADEGERPAARSPTSPGVKPPDGDTQKLPARRPRPSRPSTGGLLADPDLPFVSASQGAAGAAVAPAAPPAPRSAEVRERKPDPVRDELSATGSMEAAGSALSTLPFVAAPLVPPAGAPPAPQAMMPVAAQALTPVAAPPMMPVAGQAMLPVAAQAMTPVAAPPTQAVAPPVMLAPVTSPPVKAPPLVAPLSPPAALPPPMPSPAPTQPAVIAAAPPPMMAAPPLVSPSPVSPSPAVAPTSHEPTPADVLAISNAAAAPRGAARGSDLDLSQSAAPQPPPEFVELLWFDTAMVSRIREHAPWRELLELLAPKPPEIRYDDEAPPPEEPQDVKDRREVFSVLVEAEPAGEGGFDDVLARSVGPMGAFRPPLALVAGELQFPFDELETLKATVAAVSPLAAGDKKLKEIVETVNELLKTPWLEGSSAVAEGLTARVKEAFAQSGRLLPAGHLDAHTERRLLSQRHYQRRTVLGRAWLRGLLAPPGAASPIPTYLPDDLATVLPMFQRFKVRLIAEVHLQQDQYESHPHALRAVALARVVPGGKPRR